MSCSAIKMLSLIGTKWSNTNVRRFVIFSRKSENAEYLKIQVYCELASNLPFMLCFRDFAMIRSRRYP